MIRGKKDADKGARTEGGMEKGEYIGIHMKNRYQKTERRRGKANAELKPTRDRLSVEGFGG